LPRTKIDELIVSGGASGNPLMMVYLAATLASQLFSPASLE